MKQIIILAPDGQVNLGTLATIVGIYEILSEANSYWHKNHSVLPYKIKVAGISKNVEFKNGIFNLTPEVNLTSIKKADLIIVPPSGIRCSEELNEGNRTITQWIEKQFKLGAEVASMCSGAFMLASSGILTNKTCSTHWIHAERFRNAFPEVNIQEDKLITDENGIYTNGGAYSFLHLALYLIEKYYDKQTTIYCSKIFQIDLDRQTQSPFVIFSGQKKHHDEMILKAQSYLEKNYKDKISIEYLSNKFKIGRRSFDRRFIKATGITPLDYLQRVKVESAKKSLETTRKTVSEVMYEVGYNDSKAFREVFSRVTGVSPLDYKNKYNSTK